MGKEKLKMKFKTADSVATPAVQGVLKDEGAQSQTKLSCIALATKGFSQLHLIKMTVMRNKKDLNA